MSLTGIVLYKCTDEVRVRFNAVQEIQRHVGWFEGWDRSVICHQTDEGVKGWELIRGDVWSEGMVCQAKMCNLGLDFASSMGYKCAVLLDADALLIAPPIRTPNTGRSNVLTHLQQRHETVEYLLANPQRRKHREVSWFVLFGEALRRARYCERFTGYGWEDVDFHENVCSPLGFHLGSPHCGALGIHIRHEQDRSIRGKGRVISNKRLFLSRGGNR